MMSREPELIEVLAYDGEGYRPLVDYAGWRVAILRYIDELKPENITFFERHNETDEVFVLLAGRCILFAAAEDGQIQVADMQPHKIYNMKKGVYHSHTLSEDAVVLVVENQDTGAENSERLYLSPQQMRQLLDFQVLV